MTLRLHYTGAAIAALLLQSCTGILDSIYDEPVDPEINTVAGQLYVDASDWGKWYYIDLVNVAAEVAADDQYNANAAWQAFDIPMAEISNPDTRNGIYTYWYDVFGEGISVNEFRSFMPTAAQDEPESWTFAVHRNNVRTNGCTVAVTEFTDIDQLPESREYLDRLIYEADRWSENEVWCEQSRMLLGLIGCQGIEISPALSSWLSVSIPPIPPAFELNNKVFVLKLTDGTYGALQLANYQSSLGVKCCLTINYRYPI